MAEVSIRQEIEELEDRRLAALTSGDVDTLDALMAEDLIHVHGNGTIDGKAAYLDGVRNKYKFHKIARGDLIMRIYGDVVIVTGPLHQVVSVNGIDKINEISAVTTQSWVRAGTGWKQSTCHMGFLSVV